MKKNLKILSLTLYYIYFPYIGCLFKVSNILWVAELNTAPSTYYFLSYQLNGEEFGNHANFLTFIKNYLQLLM